GGRGMSQSQNPYQDDRGNKDRSITRPGGSDTILPETSGKTRPAPGGPFLAAENMTGGYGPGHILHDCTLTVEKGQIAVIVGPNGAGKSTAMKAVFGMLRLRGGHVKLDGEDITHLSPQDRVAKGMGFVPQ